jgi:hypothetical protein
MSLESTRRVGGPRARERGVLSGGLEVPAHVRVTSNGGSGEPSRVGCLWSRCSSRRRVVGWGATTLRRWVLHVNDPLGAALFAPLLPYQWWITSAVSIQARMWLFDGSCGRCLPPVVCLWVVLGRVDDPLRPACQYRWAVTRVNGSIQPGELVFCSCLRSSRIVVLYFSSSISMKHTHYLVRFVKKTRRSWISHAAFEKNILKIFRRENTQLQWHVRRLYNPNKAPNYW